MARVDRSQQEGSIKRTFPRVLPLGTCCTRSMGRCGRERWCAVVAEETVNVVQVICYLHLRSGHGWVSVTKRCTCE